MDGSLERPRLRPVEAVPMTHEGERVIVLRDPEGVAEEPVVLPGRAVPILAMMDGEHGMIDMQAEYTRHSGDILLTADLERLIEDLDRSFLLESERYRKKRNELLRHWRDLATRPAVHLGSYDADRETWSRWIDGFFASAGESESPPFEGTPRAIIAPHIDFRIGGGTYGAAWEPVRRGEPPDLVVILGTCHAPLETMIAATAKNFDTPLGPVETDTDFIAELDRAVGGLVEEESAHRKEHTIEFQALFVKHLFGDGAKIAPILTSYTPAHLSEKAPPELAERIGKCAGALAGLIEARSGRTLVVASADLSHVGPNYGDPSPPSKVDLQKLEISDRLFLEGAADGDPEALSKRIAETGNSTRVCGYPPIHMMLSALGGGEGSIVRYDQGVMGDDGSIVSFAAVAY